MLQIAAESGEIALGQARADQLYQYSVGGTIIETVNDFDPGEGDKEITIQIFPGWSYQWFGSFVTPSVNLNF